MCRLVPGLAPAATCQTWRRLLPCRSERARKSHSFDLGFDLIDDCTDLTAKRERKSSNQSHIEVALAALCSGFQLHGCGSNCKLSVHSVNYVLPSLLLTHLVLQACYPGSILAEQLSSISDRIGCRAHSCSLLMLLLTKCSHFQAVSCLQTADLYLLQLFSLVQGCHLLFKT